MKLTCIEHHLRVFVNPTTKSVRHRTDGQLCRKGRRLSIGRAFITPDEIVKPHGIIHRL